MSRKVQTETSRQWSSPHWNKSLQRGIKYNWSAQRRALAAAAQYLIGGRKSTKESRDFLREQLAAPAWFPSWSQTRLRGNTWHFRPRRQTLSQPKPADIPLCSLRLPERRREKKSTRLNRHCRAESRASGCRLSSHTNAQLCLCAFTSHFCLVSLLSV